MAKTNPLKDMAGQVAASMSKHDLPPEEPEPHRRVWGHPAPAKTSRAGKRFLGFYVEPHRHEVVKQAALNEGMQVQELLAKALDEWIERNGQEAEQLVAARRDRRAAAGKSN